MAHELTAQSAAVSIALTRQMMRRMLGAEHPVMVDRLDSPDFGDLLRGSDYR